MSFERSDMSHNSLGGIGFLAFSWKKNVLEMYDVQSKNVKETGRKWKGEGASS